MTEKILNTRIQLKYDTWDNWQKTDVANKGGNLVLKQGEMAVTAIASGKSDFTTPPTIMFKVGDGEHKFSELPWASGLAADVYPWAKSPTAPVIGNGKITIKQGTAEKGSFTVNQSGDTTITLDADTDTDTQYQLVWTSGTRTLKLQSKNKGSSTWTDVSGQSFTIPDNNTTYAFTEGTRNGAFTVTPSVGSAYSVNIHGLGTAAYKADTYFATAESVSTIESSLEGAVEAGIADLDTTVSGMAAGKTLKTLTQTDGKIAATFQDISIKQSQVDKLPEALNGKQDNLSFEGTYNASTNKVATKSYVDGKVVGAVQYLGTVANATELAALNPDSIGDFCRVSTAFGGYHVGDLLLCKTLKTGSVAATWDVIHGEIDKDTWVANSKTAAGYVAAGGTNANKVWKTDGNGNPGWRDDANTNTAHAHTAGVGLKIDGNGGISGTTEYSLKVATSGEIGGVKPGTTSGKTYGVAVAADGSMTVNVPWEDNDTNVTSAANHYTPSADTGSELTADAKNGASATWNTTQLVTGVNIQRDAKGHVTGVSVDSIKMPANPDHDTWRQINVNGTQLKGTGTVTGAVNFKNGSNVTITGSGNDITIAAASANNAALKDTSGQTIFTANASEDVTITVINCGTSADNW